MTTWRTSTYTGGNGSDCVEVADTSSSLVVRDSKNRGGLALAFTPADWARFATSLK